MLSAALIARGQRSAGDGAMPAQRRALRATAARRWRVADCRRRPPRESEAKDSPHGRTARQDRPPRIHGRRHARYGRAGTDRRGRLHRRPQRPGRGPRLADRPRQVHGLRQLPDVLRARRVGGQGRAVLRPVRLLRHMHGLLPHEAIIALETGAENQLCPTGAIERVFVERKRRHAVLRVQHRRREVHRLRQVRARLPRDERLALPAGAARPLPQLQRVRDRRGLPHAGVLAACRPARRTC